MTVCVVHYYAVHSHIKRGFPALHSSRGVPNRVINSLHVEPVNSSHPLLLSSASCSICSQPYTRGCWLRRLPCTHKVGGALYSWGQSDRSNGLPARHCHSVTLSGVPFIISPPSLPPSLPP